MNHANGSNWFALLMYVESTWLSCAIYFVMVTKIKQVDLSCLNANIKEVKS